MEGNTTVESGRPAAKIGVAAVSLAALLLASCASQKDGEQIVVTGSKAETDYAMADEAMMPPPPPPPPPPAMMAQSVAPSAVTRSYVPPVVVPGQDNRERYDGEEVSPVKMVQAEPVSTFSVDVDTGAYANTRRYLTQGQLPPRAAVRTEEMINYFRYDYPRPSDRSQPFSVTTDVAKTPWNDNTYLMRIGLRGYDIARSERPPANLVFLMDVSGSMNSPDKLPLVKTALAGLAGELSPQDRVSIVVYAGAAGLVLEPTNDPRKIRAALDSLEAGGSTAGGAGLKLAYQIAEDNFIKGGVNRVLLATDGDFNVGISDQDALVEMIEDKRDSGITLTTLGFGTGNYNEAMMEQIADHGNGNYAYIDSALEAKKVLGDEMASTLFTIAKDVKIQVEFNPAVISQYRLVGYENRALREEDFDNDKVDAGDIGAGHQVTAIYEVVPAGTKGWVSPRRYEDKPAAAATSKLAEAAHVKLRYKLPTGTTSKLIDYVVPRSALANAKAPRGDFAFATSVAAFAQLLRKDELMMGFTFDDIDRLAGSQTDYWRQEFLRLNDVARSMDTSRNGG
ncbi:Von Willebrand factor type A domain protein [Altererythrobacter epoxidivorans]|uniref:von Willebrand factor type A domain protein n=1 Tax=Altererythrobacter epoxidivorans TaxID=361183 RepID=A0A0M4M3D5_9SPHN|nr:VWA domain-containing protein [Altererythrobacter epoxidivorans]ALE16115.1 Von Willebrand factor type A domain protein [Altererythrobacter epoxidivorans]